MQRPYTFILEKLTVMVQQICYRVHWIVIDIVYEGRMTLCNMVEWWYLWVCYPYDYRRIFMAIYYGICQRKMP